MKPKLWDGASAIGEAKVRHLETINTPYLTASGPNFTARKRGQFTEVTQTGEEVVEKFIPYLLTELKFGDPDTDGFSILSFQSLDLRKRIYGRVRFGSIYDYDGDGHVYSFPSYFTWVGDEYVLQMCNDGGSALGSRDQYWFWNMWYVRGTKKSQALSGSLSDPARKHVLWEGSAFTGTLDPYKSASQIATGWDGDTNRYCWVTAYMGDDTLCAYPNDYFASEETTPPATNIPYVFSGNTGGMGASLQEYALPHYTGRFHRMSALQLTGKGKAFIFCTVDEAYVPYSSGGRTYYTMKYWSSSVTMKPSLAPYIVTTTNHGRSWTFAEATFLSPYLFKPTAADLLESQAALAGRYCNTQLATMAAQTSTVYVGNGVSLVLVNACWDADARKFHPMMFRYSGSSFTKISFPGDSWYLQDSFTSSSTRKGYWDMYPYPYPQNTAGNYAINPFVYDTSEATNPRCFGLGCAYFIISEASTNVTHFLYTRDYGDSWHISPEFPSMTDVTGTFGTLGAVIEPYVNADSPGLLAFTCVNYSTGELFVLTTDGTFTSFESKKVRVVKKADWPALSPQTGAYSWVPTYNEQLCFVGDGETLVAPVYSGLPGEFDEPQS